MDTTSGRQPGQRRTDLALATLFLGAFVMGSAELVVVGLLDLIAHSTRVPLDRAGSLVTAYALGVCVGGPLLTAATLRLRRRPLLLLSLAGFAAVNLFAAASADFDVLLAVRAASGALQGLFLGVAFAVAARLVPAERLGRAISAVFGGIAVATALGVPLGTLVGQQLGRQAAFAAIGALGAVAFLAALFLVPPTAAGVGVGVGFAAQSRHAFAPRVLALLGVGFLVMGGQFVALTYLTPFLKDVAGASDPVVDVLLCVYGVATAVGTFVGGRAADRNAATTLVVANAALVAALGLLRLAGGSDLPVTAALGLWGLVGFGLIPSLQYRVTTLAGPGRDLAATLPASAVNAGIAIGAWVGGIGVAHGGPAEAVGIACAVCAATLPVTWATRFLRAAQHDGRPAAEDDRRRSAAETGADAEIEPETGADAGAAGRG